MRRGHLLAEALCALALAGILALAAGLALSGARRALHAEERRERAARAERETVTILRKAVAMGDALLLRGDTAVDLDLLLGTSVVCDVEPMALLLPPPTPADGLTQLAQEPGADDLVAVRLEGSSEGEWWHGVVDSLQRRHWSDVCNVNSGWRPASAATAPVLRVLLRDSLPPEVRPGAELRLSRRGRFTLYHAGSGDWMLGWRRCHPFLDVCGVVQPIAGPLRTPAAGGLRVRAIDEPAGLSIEARGADGGHGARATVHW